MGINNEGNIDVEIRAKLSGDGFEKGEASLTDLRRETLAAAEAMQGLSSGARVAVVAVAGLSAVAVAGAAAWVAYEGAQVAAALAIKDTADEVGKLSERLGMDLAQVGEMRYVMSLANVETNEMAGMVRRLGSRMQDAAGGNERAIATFKAMGIEINDVTTGGLKKFPQMLGEIADRVAGYNDGMEKTTLVTYLLGAAGEKLIPTLNGGAEAVREAAAEAHQLGVIYGKDVVAASQQLNDNLTRLKAAAEGARIAFGSDMVKGLSDVTQWMVRARKEGGLLYSVLVGLGAFTFKMGGGQIDPLEVARDNANQAFSDLAEAKKKLASATERRDSSRDRLGPLGALMLDKAVTDAEAEVADAKKRLRAFTAQIGRMTRPLDDGEEKPDAPNPKDRPERPGRSATERESHGISDARARQQMAWESDALGVADAAARKWKEQEVAARRAMQIIPEAERKMAEEMAKVDSQVAAETDRLDKMRQQKHIDAGVYSASLAKLTSEAAKHKAVISEVNAAQTKLNASWEYGANKALQSYLDEVQNRAKQSERAWTGLFRSLDDAGVKFVRQRKIDFSSMADSFINDLIRMEWQARVTGPFMSAVKGVGGLGELARLVIGSIGNAVGGTQAPAPVETRTPTPVKATDGTRAGGGAVAAGSLYEVNEVGPELLNYGGRDYLMMGGKGGFVKPVTGHEPTGQAGAVSVSVSLINASGQPLQARQQGPARWNEGAVFIDMLVTALDTSPTARAAVAGVR